MCGKGGFIETQEEEKIKGEGKANENKQDIGNGESRGSVQESALNFGGPGLF